MKTNNLFKIVTNDNGLTLPINTPTSTDQNYSTAAPRLLPFTYSATTDDPSDKVLQTIDVINDFTWTNTTPEGRHEVPKIILKEQYVKYSTLLQNARYYLSVTPDMFNSLTNTFEKIGAPFGFGNDKKAGIIKQLMNATNYDPEIMNKLSGYLRAYYGIYYTNPTGFQYVFPYFNVNNDWKNTSNDWGEDSSESGFLSRDLIKNFMNVAEGAAKDLSFINANSYIEKSKSFKYDSGGPSFSFKFHLFNTNSLNDININWQLCFLLMYQNLPNRATKILIEPPVIYEVSIPGLFYSPYAFISEIKINQVGATRHSQINLSYIDKSIDSQPINVKNSIDDLKLIEEVSANRRGTGSNVVGNGINVSGNSKTTNSTKTGLIDTIVPDAYEIIITIKSMLPESRNLLFHNIVESNSIYETKINTGTTSSIQNSPNTPSPDLLRKVSTNRSKNLSDIGVIEPSSKIRTTLR